MLAGYSESDTPLSDDVVRDVAGTLRVGIAVLAVGALAADNHGERRSR